MCSIDLDGHALGESRPVARQRHRCDFDCGFPIEPGQRYLRWAWACDGTVTTCRAHLGCVRVTAAHCGGPYAVDRDTLECAIEEYGSEDKLRAVLGADLACELPHLLGVLQEMEAREAEWRRGWVQ